MVCVTVCVQFVYSSCWTLLLVHKAHWLRSDICYRCSVRTHVPWKEVSSKSSFFLQLQPVALWQRGWNFWLSENLVGELSSKNAKLWGWKTQFRGKIGILSTYNFFFCNCLLEFCLKFAAYVWKLKLSTPPTLNPRHHWLHFKSFLSAFIWCLDAIG